MKQTEKQQTEKPPLLFTSLVIVLATALLLAIVIGAGYWFNWPWTGFAGKTLWDWMELLIVPGVLAIGAFMFNLASNQNERNVAERQSQIEQKIALDNQRGEALQGCRK